MKNMGWVPVPNALFWPWGCVRPELGACAWYLLVIQGCIGLAQGACAHCLHLALVLAIQLGTFKSIYSWNKLCCELGACTTGF